MYAPFLLLSQYNNFGALPFAVLIVTYLAVKRKVTPIVPQEPRTKLGGSQPVFERQSLECPGQIQPTDACPPSAPNKLQRTGSKTRGCLLGLRSIGLPPHGEPIDHRLSSESERPAGRGGPLKGASRERQLEE